MLLAGFKSFSKLSPVGSGGTITFIPGKNTGAGCHFLPHGNLPNPGIKPASPALAGAFFTTEPPGSPRSLGWILTQQG